MGLGLLAGNYSNIYIRLISSDIMNPLAKMVLKMYRSHLRSKGIDPEVSEDSGEASEALRSTKRTLRRLASQLSHQDLRDAKTAKQQHAAAAASSTDKNPEFYILNPKP